MTYLQSLKQCSDLQNTIMPFNCEVIYFDFKSPTEYEIILIDKFDIEFSRKMAKQRYKDRLPCAFIFNLEDEFSFHYADTNIDCEFDLYTDQLTFFESQEPARKPSKAMLSLEFAKLKKLLSQS